MAQVFFGGVEHEIQSPSSVEMRYIFLTIYWMCKYHALHYLHSLPVREEEYEYVIQCSIRDSHSVVGEDESALVEALCSFEMSAAVSQSIWCNISRRIASSFTCLQLGPHCNILFVHVSI